MTTTNHLPDPSPEASLHVTLPSVEWMPLDDLASQWAAFASHSTQRCAFATASLAFTALEHETAARRVYHEAQQEARPASMQDGLLASLTHLTGAASSWLSTLACLEEYYRVVFPAEEEQDAQAVRSLQAVSYSQLLHVAGLSVRLVQEVQAVVDAPVRVLIGHLHVAHVEVRP